MSTVKSKNKNKRRKVTFSLDLSGAKEVILMGDFNNWSPKNYKTLIFPYRQHTFQG